MNISNLKFCIKKLAQGNQYYTIDLYETVLKEVKTLIAECKRIELRKFKNYTVTETKNIKKCEKLT